MLSCLHGPGVHMSESKCVCVCGKKKMPSAWKHIVSEENREQERKVTAGTQKICFELSADSRDDK